MAIGPEVDGIGRELRDVHLALDRVPVAIHNLHAASLEGHYVAVLEIMGKPAAAAAAAAPKQGTLEVAGKMATAPVDPVVDAYRRKLSMALF